MDAREASPWWAKLPADALSEVAGHLHDAGDFVRFHAVCRPWRDAPPPLRPRKFGFFPYLIDHSLFDDDVHLYSPFFSSGKSNGNDVPRPLTIAALANKTLESYDAATGRVLAVGAYDDLAVLVDPLKPGDTASLPTLPQIMFPRNMWNRRCVRGIASNGNVMFNTRVELASMSVALHALEVNEDGRPEWVKREHGRGVDHMCLFLNPGDSTGFAIDARGFSGADQVTGGCAYFVYGHPKRAVRDTLYRYSFKDGTLTVVAWWIRRDVHVDHASTKDTCGAFSA